MGNNMAQSNLPIFIVDDDAFILKLLLRLLTIEGYSQTNAFESGEKALSAMDSSHPALIFLDINMPNMDGIQFVRQLVARGYKGSVVLVSGEDERMLQSADKLVRAHGIHIPGVLQKPFAAEALKSLLNQWEPVAVEPPKVPIKRYTPEQLKRAIDQGELQNYYQPKIAVANGKVVGVEALVRWRHPEDGLVFPDAFIPLAEESGLIDALANCVMDLALEQTIVWAQAGIILPIAINISMENLAALDFVDRFYARVTEAGVLPKDITLEITESRAMKNPAITFDSLSRLRLKRFVLSMDDFGTGHSSLAQLRDIPFDEFKIDRSFVFKAWVDQRIKAMFDTSLSLAKQLGMKVVAEGVETVNDWDFVRKTSCDYAQGYFIAKPMPGDEIPAWLQAWQQRVRTELIPEPIPETPTQTKEVVKPIALVIEDHEFQRRIQSKILREEHYEVVTAASGAEALKILRKLRPNLILIDIELPDLSGIEIVKLLRGTSVFKATPILIVSGNTSKETLEDSRKAGANGFLVKPFDRKALVDGIAQARKYS